MALSRHLHKVNACMPELPEVETVAAACSPPWRGRNPQSGARRKDFAVSLSKSFIARLEGQTVTGLGRRANT